MKHRPNNHRSRVRSTAGRQGASARWGDRAAKATACLRVYPADADAIRERAKAEGVLPADIVARAIRND